MLRSLALLALVLSAPVAAGCDDPGFRYDDPDDWLTEENDFHEWHEDYYYWQEDGACHEQHEDGGKIVEIPCAELEGIIEDAPHTEDPAGLIWYDEELDACVTQPEGGKILEVPCPGVAETFTTG